MTPQRLPALIALFVATALTTGCHSSPTPTTPDPRVVASLASGSTAPAPLRTGPEAATPIGPATGDATPTPDLFTDEAEIREYVRRVIAVRDRIREMSAEERKARWIEAFGQVEEEVVVVGSGSLMLDAAATTVAFDAESLSSIGVSDVASVSGFAPNLEVDGEASITNNQEHGVDEGDLIKRIGSYLVLLRRGRLYSLDVGERPGDPIRLVDRQDVQPFADPHHAWYDELLVSADRLVVLGYSYGIGGTEVALFSFDERGRIDHLETYVLSSNDYYSWENYGSRLVDGRLVLYSPIELGEWAIAPDASPWPRHALLDRRGLPGRWVPLVESMQVLRPRQAGLPTTLHAVITCEIGGGGLACRASGFVGGWRSERYVSRRATYVWVSGARPRFDPTRLDEESFGALLAEADVETLRAWVQSEVSAHGRIYRLPFDEGAIGSVEVHGRPLNAFSFRERAETLDLLLARAPEDPEEVEARDWLRLPLARFAEPDARADESEILGLPAADARWGCDRNRFVGETLVYSACYEDPARDDPTCGVWVVNPSARRLLRWVGTDEHVSRIERVGRAVLLVSQPSRGTLRGGLVLQLLRLDPELAEAPPRRLPFHFEIENRSHAFNYTLGRAVAPLPGAWALAALPARRVDPGSLRLRASEHGGRWLEFESTNLIAYLSIDEAGAIAPIGGIEPDPRAESLDDECEVSCVDWYGSYRPFFLGQRIFALLDYELVEAEILNGRLRELQRSSAILF